MTDPANNSPSTMFRTGYQPERHANRRRSGSRAKLAKRFFEDTYAAWEEQGESALARAAFHDPMGFVSMVSRLMPQKIEVSTPTDGMTDERLAEMLELAERMAALKAGSVGGSAAAMVLDHEKTLSLNGLKEGGGGPFRLGGAQGVNTPQTLHADPAEDPEQEHNPLSLNGRAAGDASAPNSLSATKGITTTDPLPYPVGKPIPDSDATVERRNLARLAEGAMREDDIDPASLF